MPLAPESNRGPARRRFHVCGGAQFVILGAIASIVETYRRLDVNLRASLTDVLPKLGDWPAKRVA
jgi:hypothetical protein